VIIMKIKPGTLYLTRAPITGVLIPVITNRMVTKKMELKIIFAFLFQASPLKYLIYKSK
mgnify:CR=1